MEKTAQLRKHIRVCMWIIIAGLVLSGITAFPLQTELGLIKGYLQGIPTAQHWINTIYGSLQFVNQYFPYFSYGTDWLAFAHLVIAIVFIGPLKDPVKNIWVIQFGIIACVLIFPLAFIAGEVRQIPIFWRLIDCSFGVIGIIPLWLAYKYTRRLEQINL